MADLLSEFFNAFFTKIKEIFWWCWEQVLDFFAWIVERIPAPSFLENMPTYTLPDSVLWMIEPFNVGYGLSVLVAAFTARFLIKLIPMVG